LSPRIGERLIAAGLVTRDQVEEALRAQVLGGGRLGTNLIDRGAVKLDALADVLAEQHDLPAARTEHFEASDATFQSLLTPELAAKWHAVPLGRMTTGELAVATTDPLPAAALDELASALSERDLVVAIAPELRILYWLEKVYGIERPNRYRRTQPILIAETDDARRRYVTTLGSSTPLSAPGALAKIAVRRIAVPIGAGAVEAGDDDVSVDEMDAAHRSLRRATGRDRVGNIVVNVLASIGERVLDVAMILIVRETTAFGWKGFIRGEDDDRVEALAIPVAQPSVIQAACVQGRTVRGKPECETQLDTALWEHLGTGTPKDLLVLPIVLFSRRAGVVYVHSRRAIPEAVASDVAELADAMTSAFERLVRAAQR
jgi:hypothetical protein